MDRFQDGNGPLTRKLGLVELSEQVDQVISVHLAVGELVHVCLAEAAHRLLHHELARRGLAIEGIRQEDGDGAGDQHEYLSRPPHFHGKYTRYVYMGEVSPSQDRCCVHTRIGTETAAR
jgi:hypothetical protein